MSRERESRILALFERALELDGDERRRFLDELSESDLELRTEVERLIELEGRPSDLLRAAARFPDPSDFHRGRAVSPASDRWLPCNISICGVKFY